MKKRGLLLVLIFLFLFGRSYINVFAETATYVETVSGECKAFVINRSNKYVGFTTNTSNARALVMHQNGRNFLVIVSPSSFMVSFANYATSESALACSVPNMSSSTYGGTYHVWSMNSAEWITPVNLPFISVDTSKTIQNWGIYYTYGEGSVDPIEPVNWGQLRDVNYKTDIAGSGQASLSNRDTISWSTDFDTFGNEITNDCMVEIRAVRGSWSANTKEDLLNLAGDSIVLEATVAPVLATLPVGQGSFSIEWDEVIEELDIDKYISLLARLNPDTEKYVKEGWVYEIRLVNETDNYTGTWQKVYTATSGTAIGSESIINNGDNFNTFIYQELQQIGILNNQPTTIIIINNTEYPVENPNNGVPPEADPEDPDGNTQIIINDLWDLIKIVQQGFYNVVNALSNVVKEIKELPGNLLELFRSMITPPDEIDSQVTNDFNQLQDDYLQQNQENAMGIITAIEDTRDYLESAAGGNTRSSVHQCVFAWDDVAIDLTELGGPRAVLFPAGTYNFSEAFIRMIEGFGMTYEDYQFFVSSMIYLYLVVFIYHHVTVFLKD